MEMRKLGFELFLVVVFVLAAIQTRGFSREGTWFPLYVALAGAALAGAILIADVVAGRKVQRSGALASTSGSVHPSSEGLGSIQPSPEAPLPGSKVDDDLMDDIPLGEQPPFLRSWFPPLVAFVLLMSLVGFWVACAVWLPAVTILLSRMSIRMSVVACAVWLALIYVLVRYLAIGLPVGLIW